MSQKIKFAAHACVALLLAGGALAAPFTPGNIVVYRIGDGSATVAAANGRPVFLDEYSPSGTLVQSVAMPTLASGADKALVASGSATTDGNLSLSADGTCLAVPGYGRDYNTGSGNLVSGTTAGGAPIPRVVARVTSAGTASVTTALTDLAGENLRSAATVDCSGFWVGSSLATGGLRFAARGATTSADITGGTTIPMRVAQIFGGQLYTSAANPQRGVNTVGAGTPTTGPQAITKLNGFSATAPVTSTSPWGYFFADLDPGVPGVDTLYVADDGTQAITKFSLVGGTWVVNGVVGGDADDYRSITGIVSGTTVQLFAVRGASPNTLVTITDTSGYNGTFSGTVTTLATAGTNISLRGVAPTPVLSVTPVLADANGTVTPPAAQAVAPGGQAEFTVTPASGHAASAGGTCGGSFIDPTTYRTHPVAASCTVVFSFPALVLHTIAASVSGGGGQIDPSGAVQAQHGMPAVFTVTPDGANTANVGGTCGGALSGNTYTTVPVVADCTVVATFATPQPPTYTVTATPHGTVSPPGTSQFLPFGAAQTITITPDSGYSAAARGSCSGSWTGPNAYSIPYQPSCTVAVTFARKLVLFVGNSYTFGRVDPVMSYNAANVSDLTHAMWLANPAGSNDFEPHPWGGIPGVFKKMIDQAGLDWDVSISARNAASLRGHYLNTNPAGWNLRGNVASQRFDTVVLQDLSDEPLPFGRGANASPGYFAAYADKLEAWVHQGNEETYTESQVFGSTAACQAATGESASRCDTQFTVTPRNPVWNPSADVYLYQTWARPDMIGPNGTNQFYTGAEGLEAMTADLRNAYFGKAATNTLFKAVNPVGDAFLIAVQQGFATRDPYAPEPGKINLWFTEDYFHPSKHGSYLSALVHFAMLTGLDPVTLGAGELAAADLGITPDEASDLQVAAHLAVVPKAPTAVNATGGPGRVTVTFFAPNNIGMLPILDYTATCSKPGETKSATGTGLSIEVVGLQNGAAFTCTVAARNSVGMGAASEPSNTATPGGGFLPRTDFNFDGRDDILWRHADGRVAIWLMDGLQVVSGADIFPAGTAWNVREVTDFQDNLAGRADILWQNADGRIAVYSMDGLTILASLNVAGAGSPTVTHAVDLNGNGVPDLLVRGGDGAISAWFLAAGGGSVAQAATFDLGGDPGWHVAATAYLQSLGTHGVVLAHADGRAALWYFNSGIPQKIADLLPAGTGWAPLRFVRDVAPGIDGTLYWAHADGSVAAWRMNAGTLVEGATLLGPGSGWSVAHTGDFNDDAHGDLLWTHNDGRVAIWLMNGLTPIATAEILGPGTGWSVKRLLDLNGDGRIDILWVHTDGRVAAWLMNGTTVLDGASLLGSGTGWVPLDVGRY